MNHSTLVLLVDVDSSVSNFIGAVLTANHYHVIKTNGSKSALSLIASHCPDLVLLDLGYNDTEGMEILKALRQWSQVPVIIISARDRERDKVQALDAGADDYITKPFSTAELLARLRTALRHSIKNNLPSNAQSNIIKIDELIIDFEKRRVLIGGKEVHLTQIEYRIVTLTAQYMGKVLPYDFIISKIWGTSIQMNNQILRVNMANIRKKIEENPASPRYILTEIGIGYRMVDEV